MATGSGRGDRSRRHADLRVDPLLHPGWVHASERLPAEGETVYCADGPAELVRVLGRTDSGGRLLELKVSDGRRQPFFAAAANVLVRETAVMETPAG